MHAGTLWPTRRARPCLGESGGVQNPAARASIRPKELPFLSLHHQPHFFNIKFADTSKTFSTLAISDIKEANLRKLPAAASALASIMAAAILPMLTDSKSYQQHNPGYQDSQNNQLYQTERTSYPGSLGVDYTERLHPLSQHICSGFLDRPQQSVNRLGCHTTAHLSPPTIARAVLHSLRGLPYLASRTRDFTPFGLDNPGFYQRTTPVTIMAVLAGPADVVDLVGRLRHALLKTTRARVGEREELQNELRRSYVLAAPRSGSYLGNTPLLPGSRGRSRLAVVRRPPAAPLSVCAGIYRGRAHLDQEDNSTRRVAFRIAPDIQLDMASPERCRERFPARRGQGTRGLGTGHAFRADGDYGDSVVCVICRMCALEGCGNNKYNT